MRKLTIQLMLWPLALALCLGMVATPAAQAGNLPAWRVGSTWDYQEVILVTGSTLDTGWLYLTDWQQWNLDSAGVQAQGKSGLSYDVYDCGLARGGSTAVAASGWYKAGTRVRVMNARLRGQESELWFRRSDLAQVRRRRYLTGTLNGYTGSWVSLGNFFLNEEWEFNPPLEIYDFPSYVGEIWNNDGGNLGAFLTINTWGTYDGGTYIGIDGWDETASLNAISTLWDNNATAPQQGQTGCDWYETLGTFISGSIVDTAYYGFWYHTGPRNYAEYRAANERLGSDFTFNSTTTTLQTYALAADPSITLGISPNTAAIGTDVVMSGSGATDGNVNLANYYNSISEDTTASGGNYSHTYTVPYATDLSSTTYDLASIGIIATDSAGDYAVATLTIEGQASGGGARDDDDPGDACTEGDLALWQNAAATVDLSNCSPGPGAPFPLTGVSIQVMDESSDDSCFLQAGVATGVHSTAAGWLISEDDGATYFSGKDVAIYAGDAGTGWIGGVDQYTIGDAVRDNLIGWAASVSFFTYDGACTDAAGTPIGTQHATDGDRTALATWFANNTGDGEDDIYFCIDENVYVAYAGVDGGPLELFVEDGNTAMHCGDAAWYHWVTTTRTVGGSSYDHAGDIFDAPNPTDGGDANNYVTNGGSELISGLVQFHTSRAANISDFATAGYEIQMNFAGDEASNRSDLIVFRNTTHGGRYCQSIHGTDISGGYAGATAIGIYTDCIKYLLWQAEDLTISGGNGTAESYVTMSITDGAAVYQSEGAKKLSYLMPDMAPQALAFGAEGYLGDYGLPYHPLRGYGWDAAYDGDVYRRGIAPLLPDDSFLLGPNTGLRIWDADLPNGTYDVTIGYGDLLDPQGPHYIDVLDNGGTEVNGISTTSTVETWTGSVSISDGDLSIQIGDGASGNNTHICYVDVYQSGSPIRRISFQPAGSFSIPATGHNVGRYDQSIVVSCGPVTDTPTATSTAIPTDTPTFTAVPTNTTVPTNTFTSVPTPTNTQVPTATATDTPIPFGTPLITNVYRDKVPVSPDVEITFLSQAGATYEIEQSSSISAPVWSVVDTVVASGASTMWTATGATSETYYRVVTQGVGPSPNEAGILPVTVIGRSGGETIQLAMLGNPLAPMGGSTIQDVIGWQMTGGGSELASDNIWKWDVSTQGYETNWLFVGGVPSYDGTWILGGSPSATDLPRGQGLWARSRQTFDQTILLDGEVPRTTETSHAITGGGGILLHQLNPGYPVGVPLTEAATSLWADGATGGTGELSADNVWSWVPATDGYRTTWLFVGGVPSYDGTWIEGGSPTTLVIDPGAGFWYRHRGAGNWTWTCPVPY